MHPSYYRRPLFLALVALGVFIFFTGRNPPPPAGDVSLLAPYKNAVVEGVAAEFPVLRGDLQVFAVKVTSFNGLPAHGRIMARAPRMPALRWRARVRLEGDIRRPSGSAIPGNLNWRAYLASRGIYTEMNAVSARETAAPPLVARAAFKTRARLVSLFASAYEFDLAAIMSGITIGEKTGLSAPMSAAFRDAGAMHLLVASGSNVGFVIALVYFLCRLPGIRRLHAAAPAALAAGFYTLAAGADPPLVRAYIMSLCAITGFALQRESGAFAGLVVSGFCILLADNQALFKPDFLMSYLAAAAIILVFSNTEFSKKWPAPAKALLAVAMTTAAAQIALFPVMVHFFHRVSLAAFVANVILVPLSGVLMTLGIACAAASALPFAAPLDILLWLTGIGVELFGGIVRFFASLSWSAIAVPSPGPGALAAYCCGAFTLLHLPSPRRAVKILPYALTLSVCALAAQYFWWPSGRIYAYSAGMPAAAREANPRDNWANGVLLRTARGAVLMADAGVRGDMLSKAVLEAGGRRVDALFLSSLSESSWRGLEELSRETEIRAVYLPYGPVPPDLEAVFAQLKPRGAKIARLWPGDKVSGVDWSAAAQWGIHRAHDGRRWSETGYSGNAEQDALSFSVETAPLRADIGARAAFAAIAGPLERGGRAECDIISRRGMPSKVSFSLKGLHAFEI
ncbi:MAG: ComEC/Rec2 family competence protein [Elusimicrobiales bacterium]|nr:ComEC/Rec2 family competence protein [Elusimicrobiales bacterium]